MWIFFCKVRGRLRCRVGNMKLLCHQVHKNCNSNAHCKNVWEYCVTVANCGFIFMGRAMAPWMKSNNMESNFPNCRKGRLRSVTYYFYAHVVFPNTTSAHKRKEVRDLKFTAHRLKVCAIQHASGAAFLHDKPLLVRILFTFVWRGVCHLFIRVMVCPCQN